MKKLLVLILSVAAAFCAVFALTACGKTEAETKPWYGTYYGGNTNNKLTIDENYYYSGADKYEYVVDDTTLSVSGYSRDLHFYEDYRVLSFGIKYKYTPTVSAKDGYISTTLTTFINGYNPDTVLTFNKDGTFTMIFVNYPESSIKGYYLLKSGIFKLTYTDYLQSDWSVAKNVMYCYVNYDRFEMFVYVKDADTFFSDAITGNPTSGGSSSGGSQGGFSSVSGSGGSECKSDGLEFTLSSDGNSYICAGIGSFDGKILIIPDSYNGKPVTKIEDEAFKNASAITGVYIPDSVTEIGFGAFNGCGNINKMTLPFIGAYSDGSGDVYFGYIFGAESYSDNNKYVPSSLKTVTISNGNGVTSIGNYAFAGCRSLTSVTITDSVTSIGVSAFNCCTSLTSVTIPDSVTSIGSYAFSSCSSLTSIVIPGGVTNIGDGAFHWCRSLTSVTIPDSVTSIGHDAFHDCTSLTSVVIPGGVTSIGHDAFHDCTSLTSVTIPDSVTSIGHDAFAGCRSLTSIVIPDSVTSIGSYAFYWCTSLTSVVIPGGVTSISGGAFRGCSSLTSIVIPDSVTSIGSYAFSSCSSLTSIVIPGGVTNIGDGAFCRCISLTSVTIPDNVTRIGYETFCRCISLTSVTIPDSVTSIGYDAFSGCSSLTSVTIGNGVTSIESYAFSDCSSLTSIVIPDGVTSIGWIAFSGCYRLVEVINKSALNIVKGSEENGYVAYYALNVKKNDESEIVNKNGYLFYTVDDKNYLFDYTGDDTSLTLPANYNGESYEIYNYAFRGCSSLTSIVIPDSVTSIGSYAFYWCTSLTSVVIPGGVTSIGEWAFLGCSSLTSVIIPDSVTNIESGAFSGCTSLTTINYKGSISQWNKISKTDWKNNSSVTTVICSDGTIV